MDPADFDALREPFAADMRQALADLRACAEAAIAAEALATAAAEAQARVALLEAAGDACHTVAGASAQMGVTGLARGAAAGRVLVDRLRTACVGLAAAVEATTVAAQVLEAALPHLDTLLEDELAGRTDAAAATVATLAAAAGLPEEESPVSSFVQAPAEDVDPIVLEAFEAEAGELLEALDRLTLDLEAGTDTTADLMRTWHTLKGAANTVGLTAVGACAHEAEDLLDAHRQRGGAPDRALVAALLDAPRTVRALLGRAAPVVAAAASEAAVPMAAAMTSAPVEEAARTIRVGAEQLDRLMGLAGELVQDRVRLRTRVATLRSLQADLAVSRQRLAGTVGGFRERYEFAGLDGGGRTTDTVSGRFTDLELDRYEDIHVLARSLAEIDGDIGELQGRIGGAIGGMDEDADAVARVVADLQTRITQARMVPVGQLFTRLRLAVSDAARRLGTPVQVAMAGDDLTLDRALIDGVAGPFLHLVRNAVAHGIEAGPARLAAGKSEAGTITLTARQDAGQMVLEVRDDGRGLNLAALAARARALGLLAADEQPNDEALTELVFAPGLSTSSATDSVSGRGLGCDVARREIQRLGGSLRVTTTPGVGTVFTATLPLTLAITRALLIRQGGLGYAVPMVFLERIVDLEVVRVVTAAGGEGLWLGEDGGLLPLRRLGPVLGLPVRPTGPALLLRLGDRRWALAVDEVGFQTDIVVGSLGHLLAGHPLFAGATVTGTGELVPILDVAGLLAAGLSAVPAAPVAVPAAAGPTGPTVLVVDDSLSVRRAAEVALTGLGARVVTAVDGEEALVRLRQGGIDLVFTDLEMPKLNGYDLLREIRSVPAWRDLPVVVVTSRAGGKHRDLATSLGATGYITKPFATEALASFLPRREQAP